VPAVGVRYDVFYTVAQEAAYVAAGGTEFSQLGLVDLTPPGSWSPLDGVRQWHDASGAWGWVPWWTGADDVVPKPLTTHVAGGVWHHVQHLVTPPDAIDVPHSPQLGSILIDGVAATVGITPAEMSYLAGGLSGGRYGVMIGSGMGDDTTLYYANIEFYNGSSWVPVPITSSDWQFSSGGGGGGTHAVVAPPVAPPGGGNALRLQAAASGYSIAQYSTPYVDSRLFVQVATYRSGTVLYAQPRLVMGSANTFMVNVQLNRLSFSGGFEKCYCSVVQGPGTVELGFPGNPINGIDGGGIYQQLFSASSYLAFRNAARVSGPGVIEAHGTFEGVARQTYSGYVWVVPAQARYAAHVEMAA
jgi:hypothetical protein